MPMASKKPEIVQIEPSKLDQYVKIINEYFITVRSKFLRQKLDGSYVTCPNPNSQQKPLNDFNIKDHLMHKRTYGIYVNKVTKFVAFDIDGCTLSNADHIKHLLINCLTNLGFEREYIFTVFSGSKGYHVYLFFEEPYHVNIVNIMQSAIINKLEASFKISKGWGHIEIRPTQSLGIKLPLGINHKSGKTCWFCDKFDKPIESYDVLFHLKKVPHDMLTKVFAKIKYNNNTDYCLSQAKKNLNMLRGCGISSEQLQRCRDAYLIGIVEPHTRHNTLFAAGVYLKYLGKNEEQCHEELSQWMDRQNDGVITTPRGLWQDDVDRVVSALYSRGYANSERPEMPDLFITKAIIRYIYTNVSVKNERKVLLLMIIDYMKYWSRSEDGGFRASASQISHDAKVGLCAAKTIPAKLAARNLIVRDPQKPTNNPAVKAASLFGKLITWYTLSDELMELIHDEQYNGSERLIIDSNSDYYEQMNYYLHQEFTEEEIRQWLKRDAFRSSELLYKNYCIEKFTKSKHESLCNLTA